uniref:Protein tyrosine phosphatase type IVA 3 n=1 Tax=Piliocolobus tephrosceles TaxID=591936 RepID=A0A8C9HVA7_9PRIM
MARMNRPAPVEVSYKHMRFLITHNPTNATLSTFIEDLKKYGATTVVRVCEVTYDKTPLEKDGITVVDWPFDDGAPPPGKVVEDWLSLVKAKFCEAPGSCVAVHCVAGLGRAPVLVALALIESGMKYEDAIQFIRQRSSFLPSHPDGGGRTLSQPVHSLHEKQEPETPYHTVSTPRDAHTGRVCQSCSESSCSPPLPLNPELSSSAPPALLGGFQSSLPAPSCHLVASLGKAAICPLPRASWGSLAGTAGPTLEERMRRLKPAPAQPTMCLPMSATHPCYSLDRPG